MGISDNGNLDLESFSLKLVNKGVGCTHRDGCVLGGASILGSTRLPHGRPA